MATPIWYFTLTWISLPTLQNIIPPLHNFVNNYKRPLSLIRGESAILQRKITHFTLTPYPHNSFSRTDHIFVPIASSPILLHSSIHPITWSDHCAVVTMVSSLIPQAKDRSWCMNDALFTNQSYCFDIQLALKDYLTQRHTGNLPDSALGSAQASDKGWMYLSRHTP